MRKVAFLDTTVVCELLRIPGKSQRPDEVAEALRERVGAGQSLLLPTAAIIETGNQIAQLADGRARRSCSERFVEVLGLSASGEAPWVLNAATWDAGLLGAICDGARGCPSLPDMASQGVGTGDISILGEAEAYERRVRRVEVEISTFDDQLAAYA